MNTRILLRSQRGSSLITTLLVIVVLAIIVTAFLQSMTMERQTARSYLNRYVATLAAEAAQADATTLLQSTTATDTFAVTQTNFAATTAAAPPYCFISQPIQAGNAAGTVKYTPLVSGANLNIPAKPLGTFPSAGEIFDPANKDVSTGAPKLPDYLNGYYGNQIPEARWIFLTDSKGTKISRYCYWMEDLQGRLDLKVVGNQTGAGGAQVRGANLGNTNQRGEIAPFTLFDKSLATDNGGTDAKKILDSRDKLFQGSTLKQLVKKIDSSEVNTNSDANDPQLHFYYGLGYETNEPEIIPPGFGFTNAGQPKTALNDVVPKAKSDPATAVNTISQCISSNLPSFADDPANDKKGRAGGMNATRYLNNLAASIIDYADADSQSTTDGSTYRGMDSFPLLTQWFMMTAYTKRTSNSATFVNHHYIEVWNMSDKLASGTLRLEPTNGYELEWTPRFKFSAGGTNNLQEPTVNLQPNEKKVIDMGVVTFTTSTSGSPPDTVTVKATTESNYKMYWKEGGGGFTLVDQSGGKVYGNGKSFQLDTNPPPTSKSDWNNSLAGLAYRSSAGDFLNGNIGDPRAAYYLQYLQDQSDYDANAAVGGRTCRFDLKGRTYGETRPSWWPDPGFDDDLPKTKIGSAAKAPTSGTVYPTNPNYAMAHYGNYSDSKYRSITELGNIYDSGQWKQYAGQDGQRDLDNPSVPVKVYLSDISLAFDAKKDPRYGGGYTLRIGRPEFTNFDNVSTDAYTEKQRATALLGIFSTETSRSTRGLVNINTASPDVLRALGAGITMTSPSYVTPSFTSYSEPSTIYGPAKDGVQAELFADAVILNRPFYSQHELASRLKVNAGGSKQLFWGNPAVWESNGPTKWRDAAAEEYLRQIYDLVTVRSRNFRVHIVGQALDPRGKVTATSHKIADLYVQPVRSNPPTINSLEIKPLYEINY
jgi:type II secretory pathway pseudopilin PulG